MTKEGISRVGRTVAALKTPKTKNQKKQKKQKFQELTRPIPRLGRPLCAVGFFVFFGSQGLGSGPEIIFKCQT